MAKILVHVTHGSENQNQGNTCLSSGSRLRCLEVANPFRCF